MSVQTYWHKGGSRWLLRAGVGLILGWVLAGLVLAQSGAAAEQAQEPRFADRERVAQFLDSNPEAAVRALEQALSQEQLDALEKALFPAPTGAEKSTVYRRVALELKRIGLADDDALLQTVRDRAEAASATGSEEGAR